MSEYLIKTSAGTGAPGYLDENAPNGVQWVINGKHMKVPEGTLVKQISAVNKNNFCKIEVLAFGPYYGLQVWVKFTQLDLVEEPVPTPLPPPTGELVEFELYRIKVEFVPSFKIYVVLKKA